LIVIVDDHYDSAQALKKLLALRGIAAVCVDNAAQALKLLPALKPRAVILDYMMSEMTGVDALRAMRRDEDLARVPVLFFSALDDEDVRDQALKLGAHAWLQKGHSGFQDVIDEVERVMVHARL